MADLLGRILAAKRAEVSARLGGVSLDALRQAAPPTGRSLSAAMARPGGRFILEFKRRSPSAGTLCGDGDPAKIARAYSGAADAISVLTDRTFFGGSLDDLAEVRRHFDGPILAKDFVVDPRQVLEARAAGADAVLAILSAIDDAEAGAIMGEARRLGMDVLVEVHDEAEMRRALALDARLIGINNRDLKTFVTDLATTERLAPMAGERLVIAESGIGGRGDIERLSRHVDGFLVGSALMRAPDPREAARALAFGRVKLCGITNAADLEAAAPACFAGLVFVPGTPRAVTLGQSEAIVAGARHHPPLVAVFRDAPIGTVIETARALPLAAVQLHGDEDAAYIGTLRRSLDCEIWTAESLLSVARTGGDRTLFDSGSGGTGRSFDWDRIRGRPELARSVLAGGIGADNARAATAVGAYAIDVGSALEQSPGVKSAAKITALFDSLRPRARERLALCA